MAKKLIQRILLILGILNILWLLYFIFSTERAYVVANIPETLFKPILVYIPALLTIGSISIFFTDLLKYKVKNWSTFLIAFIAILPDAIFVIGSVYFGQHA